MSLNQDAEFDFTFIKTPSLAGENEEDEEDLSSNFEFYFQPGNLKFTPGQQ